MLLRVAAMVFVLALLFGSGLGRAEEFRPSNYDECITDSMRGVGSDVAARAIIESCRNQFPDTAAPAAVVAPAAAVSATPDTPAPPAEPAARAAPVAPGPVRDLTPDEVARLRTSAFIFSDSYRLTIRNENDALTVTELTVELWNSNRPKDRRSYEQAVVIPPLGSGTVSFNDVDPKAKYDSTWTDGSEEKWRIVAAKGRQ